MKILQVIHGYPMRYNAGSEIHTQILCHALAGRHEVHVFTRVDAIVVFPRCGSRTRHSSSTRRSRRGCR